jgi:Methylase involved in ubiquinone/menaquinone biosynthesis
MNSGTFRTWEEAVGWMIAQPDMQELVRACYYDAPLRQAAERYWTSPEWSALREFFPGKPGDVLEIGAGNGIASFALAKEGWKVNALEPDPSGLVGAGAIRELAHQEGLPIKVIQEFGEQLPFPDRTFDMVFGRQTLHHARDLGKFCQEVFRVLKPGGTFIAAREHVISSKKDLKSFLDSHPLHHLYGGENAYLLREYCHAIRKPGTVIRKILRSFESVINFAPHTEESIRLEAQKRLARIPGGRLLAFLVENQKLFKALLLMTSRLDRRPGRLVTFICHKPQDRK